jgi:hypothetical protein
MNERQRAARRRLVWMLLTRGDVGAERLYSDGMPALRPRQPPERPDAHPPGSPPELTTAPAGDMTRPARRGAFGTPR